MAQPWVRRDAPRARSAAGRTSRSGSASRRSAAAPCGTGLRASSSHPSGSKADDAETLVRSIDIGEVFCASVGISLRQEGRRAPAPRRGTGSARRAASAVGRFEMVQQVDGLLERGVRGQVADLVPDVPEPPGLAVDVRELRLGGDDLPQSPSRSRLELPREEGASARLRDSRMLQPDQGTDRASLRPSMRMSHRVTLIPGDGIGPEVVGGGPSRRSTRPAWRSSGIAQAMGAGAFARTGTPLPPRHAGLDPASRVALKGPIETPVTSGLRSVNMALRQELDLFANVRPCRPAPGVPSVYDDVDLVVVRENTEGMYTGIEFEVGTAAAKELIAFIRRHDRAHGPRRQRASRSRRSRSSAATGSFGSRSTGRWSVRRARGHRRHKANIMKFSDGLFLEVARRVAAEDYPEIAFDDRIIDALCMQLIQAPGAVRRAGAAEHVRRPRRGALRRADRRRRASRPGAHFGGVDGRSSRCSRRRTAPRPTRRARTARTRSRHPAVRRDAAAPSRRARRRRTGSRRRSPRSSPTGRTSPSTCARPTTTGPPAGTIAVADAVIARL